jgi:hypothetical protein
MFTDPLLRNGLYCCVLVPFRGNLFIELLPSSELFRLSGGMSQYSSQNFKEGITFKLMKRKRALDEREL